MSHESLGLRVTRRLRPIAVAAADLRERWFGRTPELTEPELLVFVCRGNICRSAFAEQLMRLRYPQIEVASAGVEVSVSSPPPEQAIEAARGFGLELSGHRSRSVYSIEDSPQTVYLVLEPWHARELLRHRPDATGRVFRLGAWSEPRRAVIEDPYGRGLDNFCRCFGIVDRSIEKLAGSWR